MVRERDTELHGAVRTAADILETIGPTALTAVLARAHRLEREGDPQGCRYWRRVARAMRSLVINSAAEHQPDLGCSRHLGWDFMQWVEYCRHEADQARGAGASERRAIAGPLAGGSGTAEPRERAESVAHLDALGGRRWPGRPDRLAEPS
jgi:hypothetical protein